MATVDLGVGVREILTHPAQGRVVAVYRRAAYVRVGGGLFAVVTASSPAGPLHLRADRVPASRPGESVTFDGTRLSARSWALRCDAPVRSGALPPAGELRPDRVPHPGPLPGELPGVPPDRLDRALRDGDLERAAAAVGGLGPGLTPAGDDLLAGLLLVARARWGPAAEARLTGVAASVHTTDVAAAFLGWAARGQCIAPAHDWLAALAAGDRRGAAAAEAALGAFGASSGRLLVAGLRRAVSQLPPRVDTQTARAVASPGLCHRTGRSAG